MERFTVEVNGPIRDDAIRDAIGALQSHFPWVDALTTEVNLAFTKTQGTVYSQTTPELFEAGLSPSRFNALRFLYVAESRRLNMGELKARLGVSTPLVTRIIDSLVREDWVVRVPAARDKRVVYAQLTERGVSRFEERFPLLHARMIERWSGLNEEEKLLLIHLLNKLRLGVLGSYGKGRLPVPENAAAEP